MRPGFLDLNCPECTSDNVKPSTVPALAACGQCGRLFPAGDAELVEQEDLHTNVAPMADEVEDFDGDVIPAAQDVEVGWRAWGIRKATKPGQLAVLQSVTYADAFWTPRLPMAATCQVSTGRANGVQRKGHEPPSENCSCGLYTARTLPHLMSMGYHKYGGDRWVALGRVKLWGKVIPGSQGWRSSKGYPEQLYLPFEAWHLHKQLEESYQVPVGLMNWLGGKI